MLSQKSWKSSSRWYTKGHHILTQIKIWRQSVKRRIKRTRTRTRPSRSQRSDTLLQILSSSSLRTEDYSDLRLASLSKNSRQSTHERRCRNWKRRMKNLPRTGTWTSGSDSTLTRRQGRRLYLFRAHGSSYNLKSLKENLLYRARCDQQGQTQRIQRLRKQKLRPLLTQLLPIPPWVTLSPVMKCLHMPTHLGVWSN